MPIRYISQGLPTFPPTGNPETDAALTDWLSQANSLMGRNQQESERLPQVFSTFANLSGNVGGVAVSKDIQLMGGELVQVTGYFDFTVKSVATTSPLDDITQQAIGKLVIRYPGSTHSGNPTTISSGGAQTARLRCSVDHPGGSSNSNTTIAVRANVGFTWAIEPRFQNGGKHTFILRSTGNGDIQGAVIQVVLS